MKLTKRNDVNISGDVLVYDPAQEANPRFKLETTVSTGYADISSIENWNQFGYEVGNTSTIRSEIDTLFQATTWAALTAGEKAVISRKFLVSKADRDTVHTAIEQEKNAEELCVNVSLESVTNATNDIKDAEPASINDMLDALKFAIWNSVANSFGELYMSTNSTDTIITAVNTMTKIAGITTKGEASTDFTHADNKFTYIGTKTKKFKVTVTTTTKRATGTGDKLGRFVIFKNGVEETKTLSGNKNIGVITETTFQGIIEMATNDYIEMFVENRTDTEDFTVKNMMVVVIEIK